MKSIDFEVPKKIIYGKKSINKMKEQFPIMGKKALIITDEIMKEIGSVEKITEVLNEESIAYEIYSGVNNEPNSDHVKEALKICEKTKSEFIISLGGGSCIDLAKAISVLAYRNDNLGIQPLNKFIDNQLKHIAIPTTAGTGSEVTNVSVITDLEANEKVMMKNSYYTPTIALIDPEFTYSCPKHIISSTGIDAFCHAIESLMSKKTNSFSQKFAWSSIELVLNNLEKAYKYTNNKPYMDKMALASLEAGIAFSNSSVCLVHGMSRPLGALFNIPHGLSNAMLLTTVLEFNKNEISDILEEVGKIVINNNNIESANITSMNYSEVGLFKIKEMLETLEIPSISEWGINELEYNDQLEKMIEDAFQSGSPQNNPIIPTAEQIKKLYLKAFKK